MDAHDCRVERLANHVAGLDEKRHVLLKVLIDAGDHAGDRIDDDQHRADPLLFGNPRNGLEELINVIRGQEVKRLPDQVKRRIIAPDAMMGLLCPNAKLGV